MNAVVVDASVVLKWYIPESDSDEAEKILSAGVEIHAPALLRLEIVNAFWKFWRRKTITADHAEQSLGSLERTIAHWHDDGELAQPALKLSLALDHPGYDCVYIALAQELSAPVITANRRLANIAPDVAVSPRDWSAPTRLRP